MIPIYGLPEPLQERKLSEIHRMLTRPELCFTISTEDGQTGEIYWISALAMEPHDLLNKFVYKLRDEGSPQFIYIRKKEEFFRFITCREHRVMRDDSAVTYT